MKYIPVGGGLDYDSPDVRVSLGDGRERMNVMVTADGVAITPKDIVRYEDTGCPEARGNFGEIIFIVSDGVDVFILDYYGGEYRLFKQFDDEQNYLIAKIPLSAGIINNWTKIDVRASNGKIFIAEPEREPVFIDTKKLYDGVMYDAELFGTYFTVSSGTQLFNEGAYVCLIADVSELAKPWVVLGNTRIVSVTNESGYKYYIEDGRDGEVSGSSQVKVIRISSLSSVWQPLHKDYMKLTRPVPFRQPEVRMVEDLSVNTNSFLNKLYSYAYTYVYWDGYETPLSPMTTPSLEQYEGYVSGVNTNKAEVAVKTLPGVKYVRLYCKDSFASDWVMVEEKKATALTRFDFYGVSGGAVMDNTLVKFGENVPYSVKGIYMDANRLLLYGYRSKEDVSRRMTAPVALVSSERFPVKQPETVNYNSFTVNHSLQTGVMTITIGMGNVTYEFHNNNGRFRFMINIYYHITVGEYYYVTDVISSEAIIYFNNISKTEVCNMVADELRQNMETSLPYNNISVKYVNDSIEIKKWYQQNYDTYQYFSIDIQGDVMSNGFSVCRHTLKPGDTYEFGVGVYDGYGRYAGFKAMPPVRVADNTALTDEVEVHHPKFYVNTTGVNLDGWYYQFFVRRKLEVRRQYVVRGKAVDGTEARIKRVDDYIYIKVNDLVSEAGDSLAYSYEVGDLIRFYCYYIGDARYIVPVTDAGGKTYMVEGVITDGSIEYVKIRYPNDSTYSPNTIYNNTGVKYMQFEVIRTGVSDNIMWQAIGERYPLTEYNNMYITVEWGDYIIRPYSPFNDTTINGMVIVHSKTVTESVESPAMFNPERAIIPYEVDTGWKNGIFYSRPYIDSPRSNNFLQFDYEAFVDFSVSYGSIVSVTRLGNRLFVFFETGVGVANIDTEEAVSPDGTTYAYSYSYIGRTKFEPGVCLKNKYCLANTPDNVYIIDGRANALKVISSNGIYDVSGEQAHVNGVHVGRFKSIIPSIESIFYDPNRKRLYLSDTNQLYVYNDVYNRLESVRMVGSGSDGGRYLFIGGVKSRPGVYIWDEFYGYAKLVSDEQGEGDSYNDGYVNTNVSVYDTYVPVGVDADILSLVVFSSAKPVDYVLVYAYGDDTYIYTRIPSSHFVRYENGWRADVPKGARRGEALRTHMLYEGNDLVGRTFRVRVPFEGELYGIGVNIVKRKY